jgi:hypothetical protein
MSRCRASAASARFGCALLVACAVANVACAQQAEPPRAASPAADVPAPSAEPIYGQPLMSQDEIDRYQAALAETPLSERAKFLRRHREEMDQRARTLGVAIPGGPKDDPVDPGADAPIFGQSLMTTQEIDAYRQRLRETRGSERAEFLREHRERMLAREREREAQLPAVGSGPSDGHSPPR